MIWSVIGITALAGMGGTGMGGLLSCLLQLRLHLRNAAAPVHLIRRRGARQRADQRHHHQRGIHPGEGQAHVGSHQGPDPQQHQRRGGQPHKHPFQGMPLNTSPSTKSTGSTPQSSTMASISSRRGDCFFACAGMA